MESLARTANRGSVSTGYDIDNSAAFGGANGIQFNPSSDGNKRTWTVSLWLKRSEISTETTIFGAQNTAMVLMDPDWFRFTLYTGSTTYYYDTDNSGTVFRDTSAWYHFVFQCDTTQGTAANRTKLYINGALYTGARGGADTSANIPQNTEFQLNDNTVNFNVGYFYAGNEQLDGYLADVHFTDGVANDADAFGEYDADSGIWKPKAYEGSYGTNGFYLEFKEPAASATGIGKDTSGNGNNFSTGGTYPSQATDTPTNNFCTLFPPPDAVTGTEPSVKEGGTTMFGGVSSTQNAFGTMGVRSGKWYFESTITDDGGVATSNHNFGVIDPEQITYVMTSGRDIGASPAGWACASNSLPRNNNAAASGANATGALNENEIMGVAIDMDNGKIWWHRQGTWTSISGTAGDPANGTTPAFSNLLTATDNFVIPAGGFYHNDGNQTRAMNFGGYALAVFTAVGTYTDANGYGSFAYQPPSGYYALCTKNLAEYG